MRKMQEEIRCCGNCDWRRDFDPDQCIFSAGKITADHVCGDWRERELIGEVSCYAKG